MNQSGPINPAIEFGSVDDMNRIAAEAAREAASPALAPPPPGGYDSGDVDALLITLVNSMPYARRLAQWLDPSYLQTFLRAEPWQHAIWAALRDLLLQSEGEDPDPSYLARSAASTAMRLFGDETIGQAASMAVTEMVQIKPMREISDRVVRHLFSKCVTRPQVQSLMLEARDSDSFDAILDRIENMKIERAQSIVDEETSKSVDPFSVLDRLDSPVDNEVEEEEVGSRIGTGLQYIDALHKGQGIYRGFSTLIVGQTGGGKSVVNYELIASLTAQNIKTAMFATEEDPATDMEPRARLWAACTDVTFSEWIEARCDPRRLNRDVPPAQIDRLRKVRNNLDIYRLEPVTWRTLIAELENYYLLHDNTMHDVVVIDWAGPLAVEMVAAKESNALHEALENICIWASRDIARKYQCAVVIFHQLAEAAAKKAGVYGNYAKGDTQNCRKMAQHCAAMHVISPLEDASKRGRYIATKARFDIEGVESLIQLDYEHGRFSPIDEVFEIRANRFVSKGAKHDGALNMPDSNKKKTKLGEAST